METETMTTKTLRDVLRARCVFLAWMAATFVLFGACADYLDVNQPYPEHPFVSGVGTEAHR